MPRSAQDELVPNKVSVDFSELAPTCEDLLRSVEHTGATFNQTSTTVAGDPYSNNSVILQDHGTVHMVFGMDAKSTVVFQFTQDQIDGKNSGAKKNGSINFSDSEGNPTITLDICDWFLETARFGPYDASDSGSMQHAVTLCPERVEMN